MHSFSICRIDKFNYDQLKGSKGNMSLPEGKRLNYNFNTYLILCCNSLLDATSTRDFFLAETPVQENKTISCMIMYICTRARHGWILLFEHPPPQFMLSLSIPFRGIQHLTHLHSQPMIGDPCHVSNMSGPNQHHHVLAATTGYNTPVS